jgi:serine/threonine protein kinase
MNPRSPDANLLFGLVALQMEFISRDDLVAGMQAWSLAKERSLAEHLTAAGALSHEHRRLLEPLVEAHIRRHNNDAGRSLGSLSSLGELRERLAGLADPEVTATLAHVARHRPADTPAGFSTQPVSFGGNSPAPRFRILRPHAEGGLGRVYVARDEELGREVALKEIKPSRSDDPDSRSRFTREAEITGCLEHPGIVPVYGLGTYPDGRPFYAMRLIRGDSLKEAIERFHERPRAGQQPLDATERNLQLRRVLQRLIDVCQAIHYAHTRGVLHRDLKPGNIMLGKYGETLVVDWGLAKALGTSAGAATTVPIGGEAAEVSAGPSELPLVPSSSGGSEPTLMGAAVGTPAFMSPEQAEGRLDLVGPASDVFSLGATLYQVLTGRPPYLGDDALRQAQAARFPPPRSINRQIPRPLEAICLRAMAAERTQRYASARELADELEHWLAQEPVSAYRESLVERSMRWVRKHRSWAIAGAIVLLGVTVLSTTFAGIVHYQYGRIAALAAAERIERTKAETARDQADRDHGLARDALDHLGSVALEARRHRPLLESAAAYYRELLKQGRRTTDAERYTRAKAHGNLATLSVALGDLATAEKSYQASIAEYQSLLAEAGGATSEVSAGGIDWDQRRSELSSMHGNLGALYFLLGQPASAVESHSRAIEAQSELASAPQAPQERRRELARHYWNRGLARGLLNPQEAIADLQRAREIQQQLVEQDADETRLAQDLASIEIRLGAIEAALAAESNAQAGLFSLLARPAAGQALAQARQMVEAGVARLEALRRGSPRDLELRKDLAIGQAELGQILAITGDTARATMLLAAAIDVYGQLNREYPDDPEFERRLAQIHYSLGMVHTLAGDPAAAEAAYRAALQVQERLVAEFPEGPQYRADAAMSGTNLAGVLLKANPPEAMAAIAKSVTHAQTVWKQDRSSPPLIHLLEQTYFGLARIAIQNHDHAALAALGESHVALAPQSGADAWMAARLIALAAAQASLDVNLSAEEQAKAADNYARRAIDLLREAVASGYITDAARLSGEGDLQALRARADFLELLHELGAK